MSLHLDNRTRGSTLPTDVTLRTPVYRRQGIIASAVQLALAVLVARRRVRQLTRLPRRRDLELVPDYLREDLGLPPAPPPLLQWRDPKL